MEKKEKTPHRRRSGFFVFDVYKFDCHIPNKFFFALFKRFGIPLMGQIRIVNLMLTHSISAHVQGKKLVGKVPESGEPPSLVRLRTKTSTDSLQDFVTPKRPTALKSTPSTRSGFLDLWYNHGATHVHRTPSANQAFKKLLYCKRVLVLLTTWKYPSCDIPLLRMVLVQKLRQGLHE